MPSTKTNKKKKKKMKAPAKKNLFQNYTYTYSQYQWKVFQAEFSNEEKWAGAQERQTTTTK